MNIKAIWATARPFFGIAIKGAKWYVQARYGIPVDEILKGTAKVVKADDAE